MDEAIFIIPYWGSDNGMRPLPPSQTYWFCKSIDVRSDYIPGQELRLAVTVRNISDISTPMEAIVTVWYAEPSVGYTQLDDAHKFSGPERVRLGPQETGTTNEMFLVIPLGTPEHICVVAKVEKPGIDGAPPIDTTQNPPVMPGTEPHWAQRNVNAKKQQPGVPSVSPIIIGNPLPEPGDFLITVTPSPERDYKDVMETLQLEFAPVDVIALVSETEEEMSGDNSLWVRLEPGESRRVFVHTLLNSELGEGQFGVVEVAQFAQGERQTGAVGIILLPP